MKVTSGWGLPPSTLQVTVVSLPAISLPSSLTSTVRLVTFWWMVSTISFS